MCCFLELEANTVQGSAVVYLKHRRQRAIVGCTILVCCPERRVYGFESHSRVLLYQQLVLVINENCQAYLRA